MDSSSHSGSHRVRMSRMSAEEEKALRLDLAQKLMLDFRYFCATEKDVKDNAASGKQPVTALPDDLADLVQRSSVGGVILFKENLIDYQQITQLTQSLQRAAMASDASQPLFIAIDQEGGRVFRTPPTMTTDLPGNMAIGATLKSHGTHFARLSGQILARELKQLGINTNFAPDIDVNVNPQNPVINVRAFSRSPAEVAQLGLAQASAMQQEGVLATLKHFPGHGDTSEDSHLALPIVNHDRQQIDAVDLYPFRYIISKSAPAMVMTAHIQYPALDNSTLVDKAGKAQIKPATLSKAILTDILRGELGFNGIIVSDAMNMAGISNFFDQFEAVVASFAAGTDIVVMPLSVHSPSGIARFYELLDYLVEAVKQGELSIGEITHSAQRIRETKNRFQLSTWQWDSQAAAIDNLAAHKSIAQQLCDNAITLLKGSAEQAVIAPKDTLLILMPDAPTTKAVSYCLEMYLPNQKFHCLNLQALEEDMLRKGMEEANVLILGSITPSPSVVELGGMEDRNKNAQVVIGYQQVQAMLPDLLVQTSQRGIKNILVYLRMPNDNSNLSKSSDVVLATYSNSVYPVRQQGKDVFVGGAIDSLIKVLSGALKPLGISPMAARP
ncbi:beta-N-acetylhexosaminidase [Alteromonas pelagimontana]|uniref:beta-N-acetylhexosaminidase n=1 Tax=Alteromonas pelagimontana TaxID=1858656 RepID=A0A6M4MCX3_9ALTE|nr:beta-N-acetylhexosaminidase [Alteromonas pelagimontana]QJR80698.1 beta-N-acetylhexosaminidase [Alteromonas pelagimontana]